jgi:hypothetical protein
MLGFRWRIAHISDARTLTIWLIGRPDEMGQLELIERRTESGPPSGRIVGEGAGSIKAAVGHLVSFSHY